MPPVPKPQTNNAPVPGSPELIDWLSQRGVTHALRLEPLEESSWNVELIWKGVDPFLNRVWGREEPIYLYRFRTSRTNTLSHPFPGRAYLSDGSVSAVQIDRERQSQGLRRVKVDANHVSDSTLILTELAFPGWTAEIAGIPVDEKSVGMFRAVDLPSGAADVTWIYRPMSVYVGSIISLVTLFLLAAIGHLRFWHPLFVDRVLARFVRRSASGNSCPLSNP
jgi:hypothetical protein